MPRARHYILVNVSGRLMQFKVIRSLCRHNRYRNSRMKKWHPAGLFERSMLGEAGDVGNSRAFQKGSRRNSGACIAD